MPTLHEADNLPAIVPQILKPDPRIEVIVVDDNLPGQTGRLADAMAAVIDCHDLAIVCFEIALRGCGKETERAIEEACINRFGTF